MDKPTPSPDAVIPWPAVRPDHAGTLWVYFEGRVRNRSTFLAALLAAVDNRRSMEELVAVIEPIVSERGWIVEGIGQDHDDPIRMLPALIVIRGAPSSSRAPYGSHGHAS